MSKEKKLKSVEIYSKRVAISVETHKKVKAFCKKYGVSIQKAVDEGAQIYVWLKELEESFKNNQEVL